MQLLHPSLFVGPCLLLAMPVEHVNEQVWTQRRVRVCAKCRRELPDVVKHRGAYNTAGSVAGSLGTSMGGSMLLGTVMGPVGAIGGAIGGAIVGSRAGAAASDGVCNAVENSAQDLCDQCKADAQRSTPPPRDWGGGRLGTGSEEQEKGQSGSDPSATEAFSGSSQSQRGQQAATSTQSSGERFSDAASTAGTKISEAASAAGDRLNDGWSWMRRSVWGDSGTPDASDSTGGGAAASSSRKSGGSFVPFQGSGQVLGSREEEVCPRAAAAAAAERRLAGNAAAPPTRPTSTPQQQSVTPSAPLAASTPLTQLEADEALARQLQQEEDEIGTLPNDRQ